MPAIEVDGLSKTFQLHGERRDSVKERVVRGRAQRSGETFEALRDVSFDVERGTTFGLIGHNGSGKSTLLKMLAGVLRPTSGQVVVDGRVSALLELGAGFHGELTGRENIYLNGAILGLTRKQIDASIDRIIDFAGIGEFIDAPVKVYSSGMYVRLGFSIAVTVDPEILIVDEIIAVGDEEFQRKCFDHLYTLRRQGTTIVLVTHSMSVVTDLCDRALWLDHGEVKALGEARDIVEAYLTDVNQREADASAADTRQTPGVIRLGSGEVRVQSVEFLDDAGAPRPFAVPAEPCTIRVHYTAHQPVQELTVGLAIVHETGVVVAGPNSGQNGLTYDVTPGDGYVDYRLDRLPLQPGEFWLTVAMHAKGKTYDHVDKGFRFLVRADHAVSEPGLARIFGQWGPLVPEAPAGGAAR